MPIDPITHFDPVDRNLENDYDQLSTRETQPKPPSVLPHVEPILDELALRRDNKLSALDEIEQIPETVNQLSALTNYLNDPHIALGDDAFSKIQKSADSAYKNRGIFSKLRDRLSFIFGQSDAAKAYEEFSKQLEKTKADFNKTSNAMAAFQQLGLIEDTFGSGVTLTNEQKNQWISLLRNLPPENGQSLIENLNKLLQSKEFSMELIGNGMQALSDGIMRTDISHTDPRYKMAESLLNTLIEQLSPNGLNTQFRHEFLPKPFMTKEEQAKDHELNREEARLALLRSYMDTLPDLDPRKIRFTKMIKEAESAGFEHGKNLEIAAGDMPGVSIDRLYGIKRRSEGFTSILGLGQGDRHISGTDFMPWPHETNQSQDAAIMKILRATEKSDNPASMEKNFKNAYQEYGSSLDPTQKEALQQAMLEFAEARTQRLSLQAQFITNTEAYRKAEPNFRQLEQIFPNSSISLELKKAIINLSQHQEAAQAFTNLLDASLKKQDPTTAINDLNDQLHNLSKESLISNEDYKAINSLLKSIKGKWKIGNKQFHTDSLLTLMAPDQKSAKRLFKNDSDRTGRALTTIEDFQHSLTLENFNPILLSQIQTKIQNAQEVAAKAGYQNTQWYAPDDPALGYLTHAGWIAESMPTEEKPAIFKAKRTLGLAQGDKAVVGDTELDFSALGELNHQQARDLTEAVFEYANHVKNQTRFSKTTTAETDDEFLDKYIQNPGFTPEKQVLIKPIIKKFVKDTDSKIDELHDNLK